MDFKLLCFFFLLPLISEAQTFSPPEIQGWEQDDEVETFDRDNLFNHINGAAEFYHSYGFEKLYVTRYAKGDAEITIEAYRHADPVRAYGIYSMERPPEASVSNIGVQGYYEDDILNFYTGAWYIKMNSFREPDAGSGILLTTARKLAPELCSEPMLPAVIGAMPEQNLVANSRQYIANTFMGLELLGSAYRASYKEGDEEMEVFVIERESPMVIEKLVADYQAFAQSEDQATDQKIYLIEDPFNGDVYLRKAGKFLIGFSGADLPELRNKLGVEIEKALGK